MPLLPDGVAPVDIARQLGITVGMVRGKRHSLGLPCRDALTVRLLQAQGGRRTAQACGHLFKDDPAAEAAKAQLVAKLESTLAPLAGSSPRPWELREPGECAFPVRGYGCATWSCCEPTAAGKAYCLGHGEIIAGRPWPPVDPAARGLDQWLDA